AEVRAPAAARSAFAARDARPADDGRADGEARDAVPDGVDRAGELVSEHDGRLGEDEAAAELRRVRPADAAHADADADLAGPRLGDRNVLDPQVAGLVE